MLMFIPFAYIYCLTKLIFHNYVDSLKKFKTYQYQDIPTAMIKSAPDYCSVYIISKLKIVSARSAVRSMSKGFMAPKQLPVQACPPSEPEGGSVRCQIMNESYLASNLINQIIYLLKTKSGAT